MNPFEISRFACRPILPKSSTDLIGIFHRKRNFPIEISASSTFNGTESKLRRPSAIIEYNLNSWWTSEKSENSWILLNFSSKRILITNYSIQSFKNEANSDQTKEWKAEGVNDKNEWVTLDVVNESKINGPYKIETRPTVNNERPITAMKITQTGVNWGNQNYFVLYKVDIFGIVEQFPCAPISCKGRRASPINNLVSALIFTIIT